MAAWRPQHFNLKGFKLPSRREFGNSFEQFKESYKEWVGGHKTKLLETKSAIILRRHRKQTSRGMDEVIAYLKSSRTADNVIEENEGERGSEEN